MLKRSSYSASDVGAGAGGDAARDLENVNWAGRPAAAVWIVVAVVVGVVAVGAGDNLLRALLVDRNDDGVVDEIAAVGLVGVSGWAAASRAFSAASCS